jgi:hypothetical protein
VKAKAITILTITALLLGLVSNSAYAQGGYPDRTTGHDVSWPNCRATPPNNEQFGIVGITGGLVFRPNPCLFEESHWFNNLTLYMNTGYVGKERAKQYASYPVVCATSDESCVAYDFGYNAGMYALNYAASQYVHTNVWWLDVETENSWSSNTSFNRASLNGMVDAIRQHTILPTIGYYSYPGQWAAITGDWQNYLPNWVATGDVSSQKALAYCSGQAFNGGSTWLTQYTTRLDNDYACK